MDRVLLSTSAIVRRSQQLRVWIEPAALPPVQPSSDAATICLAEACSNIEDDMDETQQRTGEVLNWLLGGATDSAEGFRQGATLARNPKLKTLFAERAEQREQLAGKLAAEVRSFDQTPLEGGTVIGGAHKAFTYLRDAISQDSDKGLVEELLRRERALSDKFRSASDDPQLPARARDVATSALSGFAEAADKLAAIDQAFTGSSPATAPGSAHFELSDEDNRFLEVPSGAVVLSAGTDGAESLIDRTEDAVVRIGVQSVAVATSQGGSLSVCIEADRRSSSGRDGPGPLERRLTASVSAEVLVKAGSSVRLSAYATTNDAQLLRTIVWLLDVSDASSNANSARSSETGAPNVSSDPAEVHSAR